MVEAVLATIAIGIFAYAIESRGLSSTLALKQVVYLYAYTCLGLAVVILLFVRDQKGSEEEANSNRSGNLWKDLKFLASIPELWLMAAIVFCGYQLFWATYSFSAFLQEGYEITAVTAGFITVAKLWMRPIGGIGAGFLGDKFGKENILAFSLFGATAGLVCIVVFPQIDNVAFILVIVLLIGVLTYAIRGLYWAILDDCEVPVEVTGLAIGVISLIGYTPDVILPQINAFIAARYEGITVYNLYFGYIAVMGLLGGAAALTMKRMLAHKKHTRASPKR